MTNPIIQVLIINAGVVPSKEQLKTWLTQMNCGAVLYPYGPTRECYVWCDSGVRGFLMGLRDFVAQPDDADMVGHFVAAGTSLDDVIRVLAQRFTVSMNFNPRTLANK